MIKLVLEVTPGGTRILWRSWPRSVWMLQLGTGQGEGGGPTKWENGGSETVCSPPQDRVNPFKEWPPPSIWLKLQATV